MPPQVRSACRSALSKLALVETKPKTARPSNAALLLARYLKTAGDKGEAKRDLLLAARQACKQGHSYYSRAFQRWKPETRVAAKDVRVAGRLIVGLGVESVLQTGITLHHTYGTPLIPGSALKGLANHYCHDEWGAIDPRFRMEYHRVLFGGTEEAGHLLFHDAWITPESLARQDEGLVLDVMTPHHGDYYMADEQDQDKAPRDFDDPVPVAFLSVAGTFRVAVSCDVESSEGERWAQLGLRLVTEALASWGVGGKSNAGYGRLR